MHYFHWSKTFALLLTCALVGSTSTPAQVALQQPQQTRPRRVRDAPPAPTSPTEFPSGAPEVEPFIVPDASTVAPDTFKLTGEPAIRIGLTTTARSVTISTAGRLFKVSDEDSAPVPLEVARVRIEPRSLPPLLPPPDSPATRTDLASSSSSATNPDSDIPVSPAPNRQPARATTNTAGGVSRANDLSRGVDGTTPNAGARAVSTSTGGNVRLASRASAPVRAAVVYAGSTSPLLSVRAPVTFSSDDESLRPVKYNEKAYRGRLEVFPNARGSLTVVNVVGLEDYVRGVVPNELSPGGYPALEALKAQAIAARTYAISHRGRFAADGFDLLPTVRSQVYGGRQTEHPLTDRAVSETRGRVATFKGVPINAFYTSTCGGRTEDGANIFGGAPVDYLRGRECALEGHAALAPFIIRTTREPANIRDAAHVASPRDTALLSTSGFNLPARVTDEWLAAAVAPDELRAWLAGVALLARQPAPVVSHEAVRPAAFATALARAIDGESRGDVLLDAADVDYLLSFRDAADVPSANRADTAALLRDGHLALYPDATLRPRQPLPRARVLRSLTHMLEARELVRLQKATARPTVNGGLVLRPAAKSADRTLVVSPDAYLFRAFGDGLYQVREVALVGGEPVAYHTNARGEVDYMEVRPAPNGAAAERFSPFTNWTATLTPAQVAGRLARFAGNIGTLTDLRVAARGSSRRVLDLEVVGTRATAHVRAGRIRSALGLREQLFVISRRYDDAGNITAFVFTGRGWGHGVGMCQVGAYGLARAGMSCDKILKSYYTGINLTKLY